MDRLFVTNLEDNEALFRSARERENIRSDPPGSDAAKADELSPTSKISE